jgi:hypothetical protein
VKYTIQKAVLLYYRLPGRLKSEHGSTQPLIQWISGVKRQGCEAGHSPPTSAEVKGLHPLRNTS